MGVPVNWLLLRLRVVIEEGRYARLGVPVNWLLSRSRVVIEEGRDVRLGVPVRPRPCQLTTTTYHTASL